MEGKGDGGGGVALCSPILCIHLVGVKKLCFNYSVLNHSFSYLFC